MEEKLEIKTPDGHIIYGTLNWQKSIPNSLLIMVHGLGGDQNRHLQYNGARFFPAHNIATFRPNLYDFRQGARLLHECSLLDNANDIDTIVSHFSSQYEKIFVAGHSLAGPAIIQSKQEVEAVILWDPSLVLETHEQKYWEYLEERDQYFVRGGAYTLVSKEIHDQWEKSGPEMLTAMKVPTKIICAGDGPLYQRWKSVLQKIPVEYEYVEIPGASHGFDEEGAEERLFTETMNYIRTF